MGVQHYVSTMVKGWWIIALATLAAFVIALGASSLTVPTYRATASFLITPNAAMMSDRDVVNSLSTLDKRSIAATYAEVLDSDRTYRETGALLGLDQSVLSNYKLTATALPDSNVLTLSADGPQPDLAATIANAAGKQTIAQLQTTYQVYNISPLDAAQTPSSPFSPRPFRTGAIAAVLGFFAGCALAVLRNYLQSTSPLAASRTTAGFATRATGEELQNLPRSSGV